MAKNKKNVNNNKRFIAGVSVGLLLTLSLAFLVVPIQRAQAFPGEALAASVWKEAKDQIRKLGDRAETAAKEAYKITKDVAFKNALRIYLTRIAEDTATYIATGDPGQKPLFLTKPGKYFVELGDAALGDYLDTISTGALGTSICDVGPVKVKIDLALRAEINPNFCVDGCQSSYEKSLPKVNAHVLLLDYLQKQLDAYAASAENEAIAAECAAATSQPLCNPAICTWDVLENTCFVTAEGSRLMNEDELAGGGVFDNIPTPIFDDVGDTIRYERLQGLRAEQKAEAIYAEINECNLTLGIPDLSSCIRGLTNFIENYREDQSISNQRCVRLCTGAKRTAKCTFTQIQERAATVFEDPHWFTATYPQVFEPEKNEVGQYFFAYQSAREQKASKEQGARDIYNYSGIGPLGSTISGGITVSSTQTKKAAEKPIDDAGKDVETYTGSPLADAIGVFTNTLTNKLIERIFNREAGGFVTPATSSLLAGGYNSGGITAARAQFAKAFTPNLTRATNAEIDTLSALQDDNVIDGDFAEAARQELTVEDAIAKGLLRADWWFGYNDRGADGVKSEPATSNGGYPASTFPILRSYRVIPVGWEIAAQYIQKYETGSYTLQNMIDSFYDEKSPFYRLVDPKWVLQAPLAICAREGFSGDLVEGTCQGSQVVETGNTGDPGDPCTAGESDTDKDGDCDTDDPPIFENTCERKSVCVDRQTCIKETADGKGCEEYGYCTEELPIWRFQGEQCDARNESCQAYTDANGKVVSYLTDTVDSENCGVDNVGCTRYCYKDIATGEYNCQYDPVTGNFTGNQIHFDKDVAECSSSDAGCTEFLRTTNGANIIPNSSFELYDNAYPVATQANFSGWTIGGLEQTCDAQAFADQISTSGAVAMRLQELPTVCVGDPFNYALQNVETSQLLDGKSFTLSFNARALNAPCTGNVTIGTQTFTPTYTDSYQRFVGTVEFPDPWNQTNFDVKFDAVSSCPLVIDDVKVERGNNTTAYREYGADAIYMKDAPPEIVCTGNPTTDPVECTNYAFQCTEGDVGCQAFTPTSGGITIPGQITDPSECDLNDPTSCDQCPIAFLGCKAFKEVGLTQKLPDPTLAGRTPIPGAEFVSLVAQSGTQCTAQYVGCEQYTNLDTVAQGGEGKEYYSRVRQCVTPSDPDAAYYFSWVGSASTGFELKRWHLKESNLAGNAPCTNLQVSSDPNAACVDTTGPSNVNECSAEFPNNPSCVQFYDEFGGTHYRYIEEVIFVTDACTPYRNTLDSQTYYFDPQSSASCPAEFAGCREYRGAATNNTRTILTDDFESTVSPLNDWQGALLSTESTNFPGHSMEVQNTTAHKSAEIIQGRSYVVEFWAKSAILTGDLAVRFDSAPNNRYFSYDPITALTVIQINNEWNLYRLGPVEVDFSPIPVELQFITPNQIFVDNIQLKEATSNVFLIKGTAGSCNGYENCAQYRDPSNTTHNLKGFSKLCSSQVLGCEALIDTHNSTNPYQETLASDQSYLQSDRVNYASNVPADNVRFLVNDSEKYCSENAKGCQELAEPLQNQDLSVSDYRVVFLKNNPDTFSTTLCESGAVGCGLFTQLEDPSSIDYFKDPGTRVCEYRDNVGTSKASGWYKKGTDEQCQPSDQWTRACPQEQSTCREYYAPRVYENSATPDSQSYYYLDSSVSKTSCTQGIDPQNGCLGFEDKKAGANTLRPKFDPDNTDVVIGQSCRQCSADLATCGRDGNSPCCSWNASVCSIDKAVGTDSATPHYCLYEERATDFEQCQIQVNGSFAVPNSGAIATATNCGQPGQPNCFQPDLSDYDATTRYCGDFACTANIVLPVASDRICKEWLECINEQTVVRDGKETTICLDRILWDSDGPAEVPLEKKNLEFSSPAEVKELANYSGLVKAGMTRIDNSITHTIEGFFPYTQFEEDGQYGALVEIPNSDFEDVKIAVSESPKVISPNILSGFGWIASDTFEWQVTNDFSGEPTARIQVEKSNTPDDFSNQYLGVISLSTGENGVGVLIENSAEITDAAEYYMLSFKARTKGVLAQGIRTNIYQENRGELYSDGSSIGVRLTSEWEEYVVRLNNNPGAKVNPENENIYLRFLNRLGNVPSEGFELDDVELKPVLHVREGTSLQPVKGLAANYFQAELQPTKTAIPGLYGEHWDDTGSTGWNFIEKGGPPSDPPDLIQGVETIDFPYNTPGTPSAEEGPYTWRFTGGILIEDSSTNRFYFNHNDGARLYIEDLDKPIIDEWGPFACVGADGTVKNMSEGWHPIKIEWYNQPGYPPPGYGGLQFGWHPGPGGLKYLERIYTLGEFPGTVTAPMIQCSAQSCGAGLYSNICTNGVGGEIVPSTNLVTALEIDINTIFTNGKLMASTLDPTVNFPDFNGRLKYAAKRSDAVGVIWAGEVFAPSAGTYTFYLYHKDGVKFYLGDELTPVAVDWNVGPARTTQYTTVLEEGYHTIKIEYFKDLDIGQDVAVMQLGWDKNLGTPSILMASGTGWVIPADYLRSFPTGPTGFIGRECRSYPQSDSLVCDYEDPQTGVVYRGWRGYCVERDPRDSRVCLNWWPIDALSGEVNVFADQAQSLTRAPLYYCAETRKKPEPFATPRYVCLSSFSDNSQNNDGLSGCETLAIVEDLKPAGYGLSENNGWVYGSGTVPTTCNIEPNDDTAECCSLSDFNDQVFTDKELLQFHANGDDYYDVINKELFDNAMDELERYYADIRIRHFLDNGHSFYEGCAADNGGDGDEECTNGGTNGRDEDCEYAQVYSNFKTASDGNGSNPLIRFYLDSTWPSSYSFPLQCVSLVQVTKSDGTSTPWTARIQSGIYGEYDDHPISYEIGTACAPYGGLPVFETPQDILNCVPDPLDPPQFGCTTTSGSCEEVDDDGNPATDPDGECLLAPLEIYHPNNPDNGNISKICSETRLGAGFYSCRSNDCRTCIGGDYDGLSCNDDSNCPNDGHCRPTFGPNEIIGSPTDILTDDLRNNSPASIPLTSRNSGIARLKQLFAKSYGIWRWSNASQKYIRDLSLNNWIPPVDDNTGTFLCPPPPPTSTYHAYRPNVYCGVRPTVSNVQVNGKDSENIVLEGGNRSINLSFDYAIDPEQAPLKSISIDWGDSSVKSIYQSSTANKIFRCHSAGGECTSCPGTLGVLEDYDSDGLNECVYTNFPRVQVKDNWGWCSVDSLTAYGCDAGSDSWYKYNGNIIVNP